MIPVFADISARLTALAVLLGDPDLSSLADELAQAVAQALEDERDEREGEG